MTNSLAPAAPTRRTDVPPDGRLERADRHLDDIVLTWADGDTLALPATWLRDNCPCASCRHGATGEHRFLLSDEPSTTHPIATGLVAGALRVDWSSGHRSVYTIDDLRGLIRTSRRSRWAAQLWVGDHGVARYDHDALIGDPDVRLAGLRSLRDEGAIVVADAPTDPGHVERFLVALGLPLREVPFDRIHDVRLDPTGYNIAHSAEALPPHTDFASYTWPPSGQVLHMLRNETTGGETVLVDGWAALAELAAHDPGVVDALARIDVGFREFSADCESFCRAPIVRRNGRGDVVGIRFSNQLMQPLDPCDPDTAEFYPAYRRLAETLTSGRHRCQFRLHGGEMIMLHGHRILHARTGFDPESGARHLQDAYFEFDDVCGRLDRLTGEVTSSDGLRS